MFRLTRPRSLLLHPAILVPLAFVAGISASAAFGGADSSTIQFRGSEMVIVVRESTQPDRRRTRVTSADNSGARSSRLTTPNVRANTSPITAR